MPKHAAERPATRGLGSDSHFEPEADPLGMTSAASRDRARSQLARLRMQDKNQSVSLEPSANYSAVRVRNEQNLNNTQVVRKQVSSLNKRSEAYRGRDQRAAAKNPNNILVTSQMLGQNPHTMLSCFHGNGYPSAAQGYNQMCQAPSPSFKPQQPFGNMLFTNQMPNIYHT